MTDICKDCQYYMKGTYRSGLKYYRKIAKIFKYDGWCLHFDEDRDSEERVCEYCKIEEKPKTAFAKWFEEFEEKKRGKKNGRRKHGKSKRNIGRYSGQTD